LPEVLRGNKKKTSDFKLSFIHKPNDTDDTVRIDLKQYREREALAS